MQPAPHPLMNILPMAAIFLIFYFILIRPQQKKLKEHETMLGALKKGDKILTTGGLYGTILAVKGNDLDVKFSETVKLTLARSAVAQMISGGETAPQLAGKP